MFKEVLYKNQEEIIWILKAFSRDFYLAWGTAIALQLWHRKSLDFDLFSKKEISSNKLINKLQKNWFIISRILVDNKEEELTLIINWVKITFLHYPFDIELSTDFEWIKMPNLESLCAMKLYTLWRRWKWKDYVDIFFIFKNWFNFDKISTLTKSIFNWSYNEKLLREQLVYYKDIDYTEEVDFLWKKIPNDIIENFLKTLAIS